MGGDLDRGAARGISSLPLAEVLDGLTEIDCAGVDRSDNNSAFDSQRFHRLYFSKVFDAADPAGDYNGHTYRLGHAQDRRSVEAAVHALARDVGEYDSLGSQLNHSSGEILGSFIRSRLPIPHCDVAVQAADA